MTVRLDDATVRIGLLLTRRWQLVSTHQKLLCWVHDQFVQLIPGGVQKVLSGDKIAKILRTIPLESGDPVADQRRRIVVELLTDIRRHHKAIKQLNRQLTRALDDYGTSLTGIVGIGPVGAATLISVVGDPRRFPTAAKFASFAGVAPLEVSSGDHRRHRVNRGWLRRHRRRRISRPDPPRPAGQHPGPTYVLSGSDFLSMPSAGLRWGRHLNFYGF